MIIKNILYSSYANMISQSLTEYEHTVLMLVWSPGGCPDDEGSIRFICSARSGAAVQNIEADAFLAKVNIIQLYFLILHATFV